MKPDTIGSRPVSAPRHTHLRHAAAVLERVREGGAPADRALRELFAQHRNAGSRDRAAITELVYGVLRNWFALRAALGDASMLELCAAQALRATGLDAAQLPALEGLDAPALARRLAAFDAATLDDAARHNLPQWLWEALRAQYGAEAPALADALNAEATVDLRVNTLKAARAQAQQALREDGIAAEPIAGVDTGLRLARREALQRTRAFRDGWVEPQDAGSQQLAAFVAPAPGETVVDFCAGAGGKTLALGALMRNRGTLHAFDTSRQRLARSEPRLARSGLSIVRTQVLGHERDARLQPLLEKCDAVLVDAPCSATGTLRRNPELRLRTLDLADLTATQGAILEAAARLVRPGGRLVYATCSLLAAENQAIAAAFASYHKEFVLDGELVRLPHRDGTDGFYAARLVRKGASSAPTPTRTGT
jgi:16S rRNA (cytosine967-C5)-methyltransferase